MNQLCLHTRPEPLYAAFLQPSCAHKTLFAASNSRFTRSLIHSSERPRLEESSSLILALSVSSSVRKIEYDVGNSFKKRNETLEYIAPKTPLYTGKT
jgi:hypothetical protein